MSTKKTTTTQNAYDPTAMSAYQNQVSAGSSALLGEINDPYSNSAFQQQQQMQNLTNANQYGQAQQALGQRLQAGGISANSPLYQQQLTQLSMQNQASQSQGYNNLLLNAANTRQSAINSAMSFQPLQTGGTQTQTTSGTGTWLPQVAGAALGVATGGLSTAAGAIGGSMANLAGGSGQSNNLGFGADPQASSSSPQGYWNPNPGGAGPMQGMSAPSIGYSGGNYLPQGTGGNAFLS
jgi:hypothetical protein